MEVMVAVQSGTLLHALRVPLKRRVSARRGGDYNEVPQAIQQKSIFLVSFALAVCALGLCIDIKKCRAGNFHIIPCLSSVLIPGTVCCCKNLGPTSFFSVCFFFYMYSLFFAVSHLASSYSRTICISVLLSRSGRPRVSTNRPVASPRPDYS